MIINLNLEDCKNRIEFNNGINNDIYIDYIYPLPIDDELDNDKIKTCVLFKSKGLYFDVSDNNIIIDCQENEKIFQDIDDLCIDVLTNNKHDWFGDTKITYKKISKHIDEINFIISNNLMIYDNNDEKIDMSFFFENYRYAEIDIIFELSKISKKGDNMTLSMVLHQIKLEKS